MQSQEQSRSTQINGLIKQFRTTSESRSKLCRSVEIKIQKVQNPENNNLSLEISTFTFSDQTLFKKILRTAKQIDVLEQHLYSQYGGHIIPVLTVDLYFQQGNIDSQAQKEKTISILEQIEVYLNLVTKDFYCSGDVHAFDLLFNEKSLAPQYNSYDKVLSKAAKYSRIYLNSIFARKQIHQYSNPHATDYLESYNEFQEFAIQFREFSILLFIEAENFELIDDIFAEMTEICSQTIDVVVSGSAIDSKSKKQTERMYRILFEGEEAHKRWEILNEKIRQLQGNVNKGIHQDAETLKVQEKKLHEWTKTLTKQFQELIEYGKELMDKVSTKLSESKSSEFQRNVELNEILRKARRESSFVSQKQQMVNNQKVDIVDKSQEFQENQEKDQEDKQTNYEEAGTPESKQIEKKEQQDENFIERND